MRRKITIIIIAVISFLICKSNIMAYSLYNDIQTDINSGIAYNICEYSSTSNSDSLKIVYYPANANSASKWYIFYKTKSTDDYATFSTANEFFNGSDHSYEGTFTKNSSIYDGYYKSGNHDVHSSFSIAEDKFSCPKYAAINIASKDELCFTSELNKCGTKKFNRGNIQLVSSSVFDSIKNAAISSINNLTDSYYLDKKEYDFAISAASAEAKKMFGENVPSFVYNYVNNVLDEDEVNNALKNKLDSISESVDTNCDNGTYTEEECKSAKDKISNDYKNKIKSLPQNKIDINGPSGCKNILGDEFTNILHNILKTIQYAGPILVAIMTIIDLVKASLSGEQDDLKKLLPKFIKRLVAAMLLFFIPLLLNLIFDIIGIGTDKICI